MQAWSGSGMFRVQLAFRALPGSLEPNILKSSLFLVTLHSTCTRALTV